MTASPDLSGTPEYPSARDLSRYAVHMTSSEENLASILVSGRIEARTPHGFTKGLLMVKQRLLSSSYSEMPLSEIHRLSRHGSYGLAFPQEWLKRQGAQPVWYLSEGSPPLIALKEMKTALVQSSQWSHQFWTIAPYVDLVAPRHAWTHERELRHVGDLCFDLSEVALIIAPIGTNFQFTDPTLGTPVLDPMKGTYSWTGGAVPALGAAMTLMLDRFHEEYVSPDKEFYWADNIERLTTADAVGQMLPRMPDHVYRSLVRHLSTHGDEWLPTSEIAALEDAEADAQIEHWQELRYYQRFHPDREP